MPPDVSRGFDIGGPDVLTYREMMQRYVAGGRSAPAGHRRGRRADATAVEPLGLASSRPCRPGFARPARRVNWVHEVVLRASTTRPPTSPTRPTASSGSTGRSGSRCGGCREAAVATRWSSAAVPGAPSDPLPGDPDWAGGSLFVDERQVYGRRVAGGPCGAVLESVGGEYGWYSWGLAWRVRGLARPASSAVRACAGVVGTRGGCCWWTTPWTSGGSRPSRRGRLLRLRAEMRVPGLAWLELARRARPAPTPTPRLTGVRAARAYFHPKGLVGQLYWWSVYPFHGVVFGGMQRNIARAAEEYERTGSPPRWSPSLLGGVGDASSRRRRRVRAAAGERPGAGGEPRPAHGLRDRRPVVAVAAAERRHGVRGLRTRRRRPPSPSGACTARAPAAGRPRARPGPRAPGVQPREFDELTGYWA